MDDPRPTIDNLLTLTDAAAHTGHTREALRQRVKRGSLQAVKGNDGQVRVHLRDLADLPAPDETGVDQGQPSNATADAALAVLVATVADLKADLGQARSTLNKVVADHLVSLGQAQERADQAIAKRDQASQQCVEARERASLAELEVRLVREQLAKAEDRAAEDRAALAKARLPFWERWRR